MLQLYFIVLSAQAGAILYIVKVKVAKTVYNFLREKLIISSCGIISSIL